MKNCLITIVAFAFCLSVSSHTVVLDGHAVELPKYTLIYSESDYDIRLYNDILWISALVQGNSSFQKSTKDGFHRIYQYIHGANMNSSELPMTAPVITSIITTSSAKTLYYVKLFLSKPNPPQANSELVLQLEKGKAQCIAVRKFSGLAKDDNVGKEMEALVTSLKKQLVSGNRTALDLNSSYTIAQYSSPRITSGRVNEVWIDVSGFNIQGC